jgi:hypothetical protein
MMGPIRLVGADKTEAGAGKTELDLEPLRSAAIEKEPRSNGHEPPVVCSLDLSLSHEDIEPPCLGCALMVRVCVLVAWLRFLLT